jgi:predicted ATPase
MHLSEDHYKHAKGEHINVVIAGHIASDNLGLNLLLDEIESGLHYTVQPEMWKLIFATAKRLNIQVFAATHSWDSITAFQQAVQTYPTEGLLVRLERKNGNITSTVFDERKLTIATRDDIEVR